MKIATEYLDTLKAFDTVDRGILLKKLENCGMRGSILNLISSCLRNSHLFSKVSGMQFHNFKITCEVPQGQLRGPFFFSKYINDISNAISNLHQRNEANDETPKPVKSLILFADGISYTVV